MAQLISGKKFEDLKKEQLEMLDELELEATALCGWVAEFKAMLTSDASPEDIMLWSLENDIEREFQHIKLH